MEENNKSFLDPRTIIAIVLVGLIWFGWQTYLNKKYPQLKQPPTTTEQTAATTPEGTAAGTQTATTATGAGAEVAKAATSDLNPKAQTTPETRLKYENESVSFELSSEGMGVKNFYLKNHKDRKMNPIVLGVADGESLFGMSLVGDGKPLPFKITQKSENVFEGVAQVGEMKITRNLEIDNQLNSFKTTVFIQKPTADFKGVSISIPEKLYEAASSSFLMPSFEHQEFVVKHGTDLERVNITSHHERYESTFNTVGLVAIGSQYFTTAIVDKSQVIPEVKLNSDPTRKSIVAELQYKPASMKDMIELNFTAYAGPKSLAALEKIDKSMGVIVNLGFFTSIGKLLLKVLYWFHSFVMNWGVAIILLTILVRMIVLPFNIASYKSMKKMQDIQPRIKTLRDRYKDDPQTLNKEMMALMRDNKVNPLGGCLPMLLQMPVFFALYQCLGQSIELYQAPFFGWITDLSLKDPFFVLPILMGVAMFIQQKITPTTMDPAQAKVMQFLPIVFSLMMITLPSGLTLYIFVSTLFGIIQQQIFMKDKKSAAKAQEAKA